MADAVELPATAANNRNVSTNASPVVAVDVNVVAVQPAAVAAPVAAMASITPSPAPVALAGSPSDVKGPTRPLVEVRFRDLSYHFIAPRQKAAADQLPSVARSLANIALLPFKAVGAIASGSARQPPKRVDILRSVSGVLRPGTLTLVLAPPGHGKSSWLKAVANQLPAKSVSGGRATYSGSSDGAAEGVHIGQLVQYVSQLDEHLPHLTVQQTLSFVHANATVDPAPFGFPALAGRHAAQLDEIMDLLHLRGCANTILGNDLMRGVSGGEKKRVTVGEGLLTNAQVLALDEISTGLDSSVTYDIVASLRRRAEKYGMAVAIALLQPTPEVVSLFDEVVLLREGCVVYHGPREVLPGYLEGLGFHPPPLQAGQAHGQGLASVGGVAVDGDGRARAESAPLAAAAAAAAAATGAGDPAATVTAPDAALGIQRASSVGHAGGSSSLSTASGAPGVKSPDLADWLVDMLSAPARVYAEGQLAAAEAAAAATAAAAAATTAASPAAPASPASGVPAADASSVAVAMPLSIRAPDDKEKGKEGKEGKVSKSEAAAARAAAVASAAAAAEAAALSNDASAPPVTTVRLDAAWKASALFAAQMGAPPAAPPLRLEGEWQKAQYGRAFAHSWMVHLLLLLRRQFILMRRNPLYMRARIMGAAIMAIVLGGLYYQRNPYTEALTFYGLFLNSNMNLAFGNFSEMASAVELKYIAKKQIAKGNYPGSAFVLAGALAHLPVSICVTLVFLGIVYPMAGLTPGAGHFFFAALVCWLGDLTFRNVIATFAYLGKTLQAAQAMPLPLIALLVLFAGFLATPNTLGWLTFAYWMDFFAWSVRSLAQNEFLSPRYDVPYNVTVRTGPTTSITRTTTLGLAYLNAYGMETNEAYMWAGPGFQLGVLIIVVVSSVLVFNWVRFDRNIGSRRDMEAAGSGAADAPSKAVAVAVSSPSEGSGPGNTGGAAVAVAGAAPAPAPAPAPSPTTTATSLPRPDPMTVTFTDITYTVKLSKAAGGGSKTLLHGISGYARPGRICALMGASGAGKTTLLDVLASRKNSGTMTGEIRLNGFLKDPATFNRVTAYVEQTDMHMPLATVREAVTFSAALRLADVDAATRAAWVEEVLQLLELDTLADRLVGAPGAAGALAPAERKRLTIAVELASNAPVIFADEPTSGLDSRAAAIVARVLRRVAAAGRTVIVTVHQPSAEIFGMMDDLLLLQRGGYTAFFGELGHGGKSLVRYLTSIPGVPPYPKGMNTASWMLDVIAGTDSSGGKGKDKAVEHMATPPLSPPAGTVVTGDDLVAVPGQMIPGPGLHARYLASPTWAAARKTLDAFATPPPGASPVKFRSTRAQSPPVQLAWLVRRQWLAHSRNVGLNVGRLIALCLLSVLFGMVWYDAAGKATDIGGVQTLIAAIFMCAAFSAMIQLNTGMPAAFSARPTFYRETSSRMYVPLAYQMAGAIVELPWLAWLILCSLPISYFMLKLSPDASTFFFHYFACVVLAYVYWFLGTTIAYAVPTIEVAQALGGLLLPIFFLFGGLWSPPSQMAPGAAWVTFIDPITYAFKTIIPPHFWNLPQQVTPITSPPSSPELVYSYVSNKYEVYYPERWQTLGFLAIFIVVFGGIGSLAVTFIRHLVR